MLLTTTRGLRLLVCDGSSSIPSSGFPWHDPSGRRQGGSAWGKRVSVYLLSLNCKQRITSSHCPLMGKNGSHSLQVPFRKSKWVGLASSQPLHHALGFAVFKLFSLFLAFLLSPKKNPYHWKMIIQLLFLRLPFFPLTKVTPSQIQQTPSRDHYVAGRTQGNYCRYEAI